MHLLMKYLDSKYCIYTIMSGLTSAAKELTFTTERQPHVLTIAGRSSQGIDLYIS